MLVWNVQWHNKQNCICILLMWSFVPSVLWRCWLGGRKGIRPVKKLEWWGAGVAICLERSADLHMAQLMPLPLTVSCFSKIQIGFTFLVLAHPDSPGQRAIKWVCVCMWYSKGYCNRGFVIFFRLKYQSMTKLQQTIWNVKICLWKWVCAVHILMLQSKLFIFYLEYLKRMLL